MNVLSLIMHPSRADNLSLLLFNQAMLKEGFLDNTLIDCL